MRPLVWVIAAGILVRVVVAVAQPAPDGLRRVEPSVVADNINAGKGFIYAQYGADYRAWKEPLYIVLLAWVTRVFGESPFPLLCLHGLFGIGAAVGIALLARHLLGDPTGAVLAGIVAAVNPFLVYYDTRVIHPLSLNACLFVATVGSALFAMRGDPGPVSLRRAVWAGVVMGAALWQKAALLVAGAAAWGAAALLGPFRRRALLGVIWFGTAALVISPWFVRNYRLFDRFVITTDAAHILWLGNNPWSNGTYTDGAGQRVIALADPAFLARINGAPELEQHDLFLQEARRFIVEHPGRFGSLVMNRLAAFVWFSPNAGAEYAAWQQRLYRLAYVALLVLGLAGFGLFWNRAGPEARRQAIVLLAAVAGMAALHGVTAINLKHRVPLELALAVFSGESLARGFRAIRSRIR